MIELTVAMPMYLAKRIVWLPFESLIRQKDIDFEWEIVAAEEQNTETFGEIEIEKYRENLEKIGCKRIIYIPIQKHIPLPNKYKLIADNTSESSKIFIIQSADCYSQPKRLVQTYDIIAKQGYDWTFSNLGLFYNIKTEHTVLYDQTGLDAYRGLNMAAKTELIRQIVPQDLKKGIDKWLVSELARIKGKKSSLLIKTNDSEDYLYGLDTQGLNTISIKRYKKMLNRNSRFKKTRYRIQDILAPEVVERLLDCKQYCRKGFTI